LACGFVYKELSNCDWRPGLVTSHHIFNRVLADSCLGYQLAFANITTHTFLEIDLMSANRASRATVFTHLAYFAMLDALDTKWREKGSNAECSS
jgi:hypothetical protein